MTNGARELTLNWQRLRASDRTTVRPDLFAGLGVAAYLVPQVMAYATLAGPGDEPCTPDELRRVAAGVARTWRW